MHVLEFLKGFPGLNTEDSVEFEYRLLCSGEIYNASVHTADWRKSAPARILCDSPFWLSVVSIPFSEFPQELALRFSAPLIKEESGNTSVLRYPDSDIARDLAALLSLVLRRLITVAAKTREIHPRDHRMETRNCAISQCL